MACEVSWYRENQIVLIRFFDQCTVDDIVESNRLGSQYVAAATGIIHMIVDVTDVTSFPVNVFELGNAVKNRDTQKLGWLVLVIKQSGLLQFAASTVLRWFAERNRWAIANSLDEALIVIDRHDDNVRAAE
jgi:hypothetical protein